MARKKPDVEDIALRWRRTKIIATLGPASDSLATIERLINAGVDLVRLNMSHGDEASHRNLVSRVRRASKRIGKHVAILMDLCGPKIRVGKLENGSMELKAGSKVIVTTREIIGKDGVIPSQYRSLHKDLKKGESILLDDGKYSLRVIKIVDQDVHCRVIDGGLLRDHKGMNLPDSKLSTSALTPKDRKDAQLAVELDADFLALSFVRSAADIVMLKRHLKKLGKSVPIISKIERPESVENIDEIMRESFGIMIARGDLGIELPAERVPLIQKKLVSLARQRGVPVIIATQMLESMMSYPRPTRAEVGDVASAALLSADATMLSGETAAGDYPIEAVKTMDRVLREVEKHQWQEGSFALEAIADRKVKTHFEREAMAHAAVQLSQDLELDAIVVPTNTGTTARIMSAHRPVSPMVGACVNDAICRQMALHWGIVPVHIERKNNLDWREICEEISSKSGLGKSGHNVLLVSGFNDDPVLAEPVLKLMHL